MTTPKTDLAKEFSSLKNTLHDQRKTALAKRLAKNPVANDLEYLLGAFLEMYEPHLHDAVLRFSRKGYLVDVSSGFSGSYAEAQCLNCYLHPDYITRRKLEKMGIKFRDFQGLASLTFWPDTPDIELIKKKWLEIIKLLPDKGVIKYPSAQAHATEFRMKYVPRDKQLQKQRLFERLYYSAKKEIQEDSDIRKGKNVRPDKIELSLGAFVEDLEVQVRDTVVQLYKKGYSIDASGFMNDPSIQMIEGDFSLDPVTIEKLHKLGVGVETNASGYTRIQFAPLYPDKKRITQQWLQIAALFPKKSQPASPSMTTKAREFRSRFSA